MDDPKAQGCADKEGHGGRHAPPQCFQICKKVGQKGAMLQENRQKFFCDFFSLVTIGGQLVKTPPPQQKVSRNITAKAHSDLPNPRQTKEYKITFELFNF